MAWAATRLSWGGHVVWASTDSAPSRDGLGLGWPRCPCEGNGHRGRLESADQHCRGRDVSVGPRKSRARLRARSLRPWDVAVTRMRLRPGCGCDGADERRAAVLPMKITVQLSVSPCPARSFGDRWPAVHRRGPCGGGPPVPRRLIELAPVGGWHEVETARLRCSGSSDGHGGPAWSSDLGQSGGLGCRTRHTLRCQPAHHQVFVGGSPHLAWRLLLSPASRALAAVSSVVRLMRVQQFAPALGQTGQLRASHRQQR
ncbi:hypothetical protein UA75_00205 [Actinoalloteichus sp. GBA129-24]|uniref:Uncharacterized protein n=1 Tax=Actinoalloteichus fjordicus TaxID=1612552 RepID=A0AAC9PPS0_9PSEU|nr:hypothetical protein UA74_00205 [Actinoalloteichus fjordicus]APU18093.1 hypothetical protein UA75_00205 [Actinoalloteichus sp. GBA129-24]